MTSSAGCSGAAVASAVAALSPLGSAMTQLEKWGIVGGRDGPATASAAPAPSGGDAGPHGAYGEAARAAGTT